MTANLSLAGKAIVSDVSQFGRILPRPHSFENESDEVTSAVSTTRVIRWIAAPHGSETWDEPFYSAYADELCQQHVLAAFPGAVGWAPGARTTSEPLPKQTHGEESQSAIPDALWPNWEALRRSGLSEQAFNTIFVTAANRSSAGPSDLGPINANSLKCFLEFWGYIGACSAQPEISFSPRGLVQAEWYKNESNFLVVEFRDDGTLFFSLWDNGLPIEGIQTKKRKYELADMFRVRRVNPLLWGD